MQSSIGTSLRVESEIGGRLAPSIRLPQQRKTFCLVEKL
jgi:hypothetical protein